MGGSGSRYTSSDEVFNMVGLGADEGQARSDLRRFVERQLYLSCASGSMVDTIATCFHMYSRHEFTQFSKAFPLHEVGSTASGKARQLFLSVVTSKAIRRDRLF
jgi:hypothetical protein